eukprot:TRINITY_DN29495_c0_g1_i1.p1 TRINITY_DN29495_c0_g1~~TRINITY_DN29495_c0_g1_i1.p1  ORF type:complete len:167 (-),score=40.15 TRINITY_DN29495_c0_g1_i1:62-562(-)
MQCFGPLETRADGTDIVLLEERDSRSAGHKELKAHAHFDVGKQHGDSKVSSEPTTGVGPSDSLGEYGRYMSEEDDENLGTGSDSTRPSQRLFPLRLEDAFAKHDDGDCPPLEQKLPRHLYVQELQETCGPKHVVFKVIEASEQFDVSANRITYLRQKACPAELISV